MSETTKRPTYLDALTYAEWSVGEETLCQQLLAVLLERHEWSWHMFDGNDYFKGQQREFALNRIVRVLDGRGFAWAHEMHDAARDAHNAAMKRIEDEYQARIAGSKYVPMARKAQ